MIGLTFSPDGYGVFGTNLSSGGNGVIGDNPSTTGGGGGGVIGLSHSADFGFSYAIRGTATANTGSALALFAETFSPDGTAGYFLNRGAATSSSAIPASMTRSAFFAWTVPAECLRPEASNQVGRTSQNPWPLREIVQNMPPVISW